jgi:hypothetical protein
VFLIFAAEPAAIDALYFGGRSEWRRDVWSEYKVDGPFMQNGFHPLDPDVNIKNIFKVLAIASFVAAART